MLQFSGEMEHRRVRDGNGMRSAMVPIRVDARKADGGRKSGKRRNEKRQGQNVSAEEDARKREKERNKKSPLLAGAGMGNKYVAELFCSFCSFRRFCNGGLGFCLVGGSCLLGTTSALGLLFGLGHVLVVVNQLDEAHRGGIAGTETGLDDAGVATGTICDLYADFLEELGHSVLILEVREDHTTAVGGVLLRLRDKGLDVLLQRLCLCDSRSDSFVLDQRYGHVSEHGRTVRSSTTEMVEFLIVSHLCTFV